jgi:glycolate oxidase FAD binding subunit
MLTPATAQEAAQALRDADGAVRLRGAGTKLDWGRPVDAQAQLSTAKLDAIVEHNEGDLTAVLQAGVPLVAAQERFLSAGQMLALDPPPSEYETIGGIIAAGDSGPLRHRYGAPRDLVLGVQVALPDGSVARAGSKVIKNVAGYDLAKLMSGALGTLGLIVEVSVRLHPHPEATLTAVARGECPQTLAAAAAQIAHRPVEAEGLDLRWEGDTGMVLVRLAGPSARQRGDAVAELLREHGLEVDCRDDDDELWAEQRELQRRPVAVRVSTTPSGLAAVVDAARRHGATVVARAALGLAWLSLPQEDAADAVQHLRRELPTAACVVQGAPEVVRRTVDPWGPVQPPLLELMRRVKERFDPRGVCNPGIFAGGI